jgi:hypothetical protein
MNRTELRTLIESATSFISFFETQVLTPIPWIFKGEAQHFQDWRQRACGAIGVAENAIFLVGSAATGYSLSPSKAARAFKPVSPQEPRPSDIDIAIVDQVLFLEAWDSIVASDRKRTLGRIIVKIGIQNSIREDIDKLRLDIYHGAIANKFALPGTSISQRFRGLFSAITRQPPFQGHRTNARIYRRHQDFISYHEQSLRQLLTSLQSKRG